VHIFVTGKEEASTPSRKDRRLTEAGRMQGHEGEQLNWKEIKLRTKPSQLHRIYAGRTRLLKRQNQESKEDQGSRTG